MDIKRTLGQTGIKVSPLGLGTVKFGRNQGVKYPQGFDIPDDNILSDLLAVAKYAGINVLDTAPAYGNSEERLGTLLKGQRKDWVIIGKVGEEFEDGKSSFHFTRKHFEKSLERSLKRLQTDYIDILLIHSDGRDMDILTDPELIETMISFKERGLVRAIGASTKTVAGGIKALELMDIAMVAYNPLYQDEKKVLDYALRENKGILLKKALASGHIDKFGDNPLHTAMKFALSHEATGSIIIGTINKDHLLENIATAEKIISNINDLHYQ